MTPILVRDNATNKSLVNAILVSKSLLGNSALLIAVSNVFNIALGKFCHAVSTTTERAPLRYPIIIVVDISAKEKMIRSYTRRVIAAMEHLKSVWYGAEVYLPREAMGATSRVKASVSIFISQASPRPAMSSFVDLIPKPINYRDLPTLRGAIHSRFAVLPLRPRMKRLFTSLTEKCYFKSSQGLNLQDRFGIGQARLLLKQFAGRLYFSMTAEGAA